jgi:ubiquitin-like protein Pup
MASRDSGQEHAPRRQERADEVDDVAATGSADAGEQKEALDAEVDAILDEIDEVLETNAEEFVRQFVQKGGQ